MIHKNKRKSKQVEGRIKLTPIEVFKIILPYFREKLFEQLRNVLPIVCYLFVFQLMVLRIAVLDAGVISLGLTFVIIGLMFFMEGLKLGIMPFGETIGATLPQKSSLLIIIGFAFILGIGATLAEPAVGILKSAGANIKPQEAPLLYAMLTRYSELLVLVVGIGVGVAVVLGILRFLLGWSLRILIIPIVLVLAGMSILAHVVQDTSDILGLAWDCGGVTTGPVTVPLVLSLGIGVCRVTGKADTGMSGFGIVTLASLFPIMAVLGLGFYLRYSGYSGAELEPAAHGPISFLRMLLSSVPVRAILVSAQAILPLCLFLFAVHKFVLREQIPYSDEIILGIVFALFGMVLFNLGLSLGLVPLGNQVGGTVPGAFSQITTGVPPQPLGPLYGDIWGRAVAILFAFLLGYGATLAEPALNTLGMKVEDITIGAFRKKLLMQTVAFGVGIGVALGIVKIIFNVPLVYLLLPPYILLLLLSVISSEEFVNIGWDSAGVTTGPITVPLVIAIGLGIGNSIPTVIEGFGIISMASVCPILTVLTVGFIVRRIRREK